METAEIILRTAVIALLGGIVTLEYLTYRVQLRIERLRADHQSTSH